MPVDLEEEEKGTDSSARVMVLRGSSQLNSRRHFLALFKSTRQCILENKPSKRQAGNCRGQSRHESSFPCPKGTRLKTTAHVACYSPMEQKVEFK
jgi:hypothetical protein